MIGQFGVGFYSAYLVADRVSVTSRPSGAPCAYTWESAANGTFTVTPSPATEHAQLTGTSITLHIKEDCAEYVEEDKVRTLKTELGSAQHGLVVVRIPLSRHRHDATLDRRTR